MVDGRIRHGSRHFINLHHISGEGVNTVFQIFDIQAAIIITIIIIAVIAAIVIIVVIAIIAIVAGTAVIAVVIVISGIVRRLLFQIQVTTSG